MDNLDKAYLPILHAFGWHVLAWILLGDMGEVERAIDIAEGRYLTHTWRP